MNSSFTRPNGDDISDDKLIKIQRKINVTSRPGKICVSAEKVRASLDFSSYDMNASLRQNGKIYACMLPENAEP